MKHDPSLVRAELPVRYGRCRGVYSRFRYWSRSYLIDFLRETGELTQLGGETALRTVDVYAVNQRLRKLGYTDVMIYNDDAPEFLGAPKNEPDYEAIYAIIRRNPARYFSKKSRSKLFRKYRTTGLDY